MGVVHDNAQLIQAYQAVLDAAQKPTMPPSVYPAQAQATMSSNVMTLSSVVGVVQIGGLIAPTNSSTGMPANMTIVSQTSGTTGGAGVYTTNAAIVTPITTAVPVTITPQPVVTNPWPSATDPDDLNTIMQDQTSIIRTQTALLQQYQDLLNASAVPAPPTGP
jgi:hypothetical protein